MTDINPGAGGSRNADHEVAGGGGDLEGQTHGLVHSQYFDSARADAEQSRETASEEHDAKTRGDTLCHVGFEATFSGIFAFKPQPIGESAGMLRRNVLMMAAEAGDGGIEQHNAENDADGLGGDHRGKEGADQRTESGGDLEEHADA